MTPQYSAVTVLFSQAFDNLAVQVPAVVVGGVDSQNDKLEVVAL